MKPLAIALLLFTSLSLFASCPIECEGRTEVTYIHPQKESWHRITCYDPVEIDWNKRILRCIDSGNSTTQIQFMDAERQVYADNLIIHYDFHKDNLDLQDLNLFGNVKLLQQEIDPASNSSHVQYALADQLNYDHETENLFLSAHEGKNVLYFDETNHYRMSAPKIQVTKNPETQKFAVKGIGAVHFTFKEEELKEMKENFSTRPLLNGKQ